MTKRKKILILIIFSITSLKTLYGQGFEDRRSPQVFEIQKKRLVINNYKNYDSVLIDNSEDFLGQSTDNGGSLTGCFKRDSLIKIIEWIGLSNKVIENEYYFENEKLFFVCTIESKYKFNERTQKFDYSKLEKGFRRRYYFEKEKLFDTDLKDKKYIATRQQDGLTFLKSSKEYIELLKSKRK